MKLTKEEAVKLHIEMWTAMKEALGDKPGADERNAFKKKWCEEHFPVKKICNDCFLCEYAIPMAQSTGNYNNTCTMFCPIDWKKAGLVDCCSECEGGGEFYEYAPISEILDLPVREDAES